MARFPPSSESTDLLTGAFGSKATYTIRSPCSVPVDDAEAPLVMDGGARR